MDLERVHSLYMKMDSFLRKHGSSSIRNQHSIVKAAIDMLESSENEKTKIDFLIRSYKSLFTGKGGLTEFHVWDNDYEKRCLINRPFQLATNELWEIMKPYI